MLPLQVAKNEMNRREFLASSAGTLLASQALAQNAADVPGRTGRLKQGAMSSNFDPKMPFEEQCKEAAKLGMWGFDLIGPNNWPTLKKYGLVPTMGPTGGVTFEDGLIRPELHAKLEKSVGEAIDQCAAGGCASMITVGGQRRGMSYEEGADHCVAFFNRIKSHLEDKNVNICIEVMNSKFQDARLGRWDQICDHVDWAVNVCKRVDSPKVKFLFDIYHVQVADGNVVQRIRDNFKYIGHFHTGGVPDRRELDDTQELNYRFIAKAIADLGFTGYVSHEYRPSPGRDPIASLKQAVDIMRV
jgi:hydroxypyruvate isomerase